LLMLCSCFSCTLSSSSLIPVSLSTILPIDPYNMRQLSPHSLVSSSRCSSLYLFMSSLLFVP
jgi:hypothetical protein